MKVALAFALVAVLAMQSFAAVSDNSDDAMLQALSSILTAEAKSQHSNNAPVADVQTSMTSIRLVRYIRITATKNDWMSFSWVGCFDRAGQNVCAGKPASAKNRYGDPWGNPQTPLSQDKNVNTGAGNCFHSGSPEAGNWWMVDLGFPGVDLTEIRYRYRNDGHANQGSALRITLLDKDGSLIEGSENTFLTPDSSTAGSDVVFKVLGTPLGYNGKYDSHLAPIIEILDQLRAKLIAQMQASQQDVQAKTEAARVAKEQSEIKIQEAINSAAKAAGILEEAKTVDSDVATKSNKEIEMIDSIKNMVHTLNGKQ